MKPRTARTNERPCLYLRAGANQSLALMKGGSLLEAANAAGEAVRRKPGWAKGYYRQGMALAAAGSQKLALAALSTAAQLEPTNSQVDRRVERAPVQLYCAATFMFYVLCFGV